MMVPATGPQRPIEPDPEQYLAAPVPDVPPADSPIYDTLWAELHRELAAEQPLITEAEARAETAATPAGGG